MLEIGDSLILELSDAPVEVAVVPMLEVEIAAVLVPTVEDSGVDVFSIVEYFVFADVVPAPVELERIVFGVDDSEVDDLPKLMIATTINPPSKNPGMKATSQISGNFLYFLSHHDSDFFLVVKDRGVSGSVSLLWVIASGSVRS